MSPQMAVPLLITGTTFLSPIETMPPLSRLPDCTRNGAMYMNSRRRREKKRKGTDAGSSSTVNSESDISEALTSISRDLSLSSSSDSSSSSGKTDEDIQKDDLELQQGVDAVENHNLSLDNDLVHGSSVPKNENEIQTKGTFNAEEISQELSVPVPKVGMKFSSQEEAYEFYSNYSRGIGFRVRKAKVQRSANRAIRKRFFFCSKEGFRSKKQHDKKTKYKRRETRTGCKARIQLTVKEDGKWVISQFLERHSHTLGVPSITIPVSKSLEANANKKDGEATKSAEIYKMGIVSYVQKKEETNLRPEDAQSLINYLRQLQVEDPLFFYTVQLDSKCPVTNFFWRDGQSKRDYEIFGDVVILDTTVNAEKYDMILAEFRGINHHRRIISYGSAFLLDESMEAYIWLFETFVEAMGRRQPKTIFTDESLEMGDAIKYTMPKTQQKFGLWYIMRNSSKHLAPSEQVVFKSLFRESISECETEEDFKSRWKSLLGHFGGNPWVLNLHASREKWSPLFSKNSFTAYIQDRYALRDFTTGAGSLSTLVQQYLDASVNGRLGELLQDYRCKEVKPWMILENSSIENQAASEYTDSVFKIFQKELRKILFVQVEEVLSNSNVHVFKAKEIGQDHVIFYVMLHGGNDCSIECSCKKFESAGILCCHALKVLEAKQISQIPHQYILRRWTKSAKTSP